MSFASSHRSGPWGALGALALLLASPSAQGAITLVGDAASAFDSKVFQTGLATPTDLAVLADGRVVIIQKAGDFATVVPGGDTVEDHIDVSTTSEQGLLGIVADPDFETNHYIYVYADNPASQADRHQILRYELGADSKLGTKTVVLDMGLEGPANHDGGGIDIYQGNLYMGVGDTGANASPPKNRYGTCLNKGNGKILRISLAEATLGQPPDDNPLMNVGMVTGCDSTNGAFKMAAPDKRIWAWGFRNPFRLWVDKTTGKVWVGDVGEVTREEVDVVQAGKHHGYPFREGNQDWKQDFAPDGQCMGVTPASECIPPVYEYERVGMDASVIGGRILDGCDWPAEWKSRYIFGDYNLNKVWTVDVNATRDGVTEGSRKDFATSSGLTGIRMGTDNALYLLEEGGTVTRITAKGATATPGSCPSVNGEAGGSSAGGSGSAGSVAGAPSDAGSPSETAGTANTHAGAGSAGASTDSGGCGCRVAGAPNSRLGWAALAAGLVAAARRRQRRSTS